MSPTPSFLYPTADFSSFRHMKDTLKLFYSRDLGWDLGSCPCHYAAIICSAYERSQTGFIHACSCGSNGAAPSTRSFVEAGKIENLQKQVDCKYAPPPRPNTHILTGTAVGTCTLEFVIEAGIATGMVCPLGRCNSRGKGPGTGL